jgi:predicted amidohydrolase YtcJ
VDVQACFDAGKGGIVESVGPMEFQNTAPIGPLDRAARLSIKHWKKYLDGSFGSRTAWLTESYLDKETFGESLIDTPELLNEAKQALDKGFYLSFHCIGDAAMDQALEVGDRLAIQFRDRMDTDQKLGGLYSSNRLEHAQLIRADQLERMARQGIWTLCVQPGHRLADEPFIENRIGPSRAKQDAYRAGSLLDHSLAFGLSSDAPIDVLDPSHVIHAAMSHPVHSEKLSFSEAIWAYTTGSRLALGLDPNSISVGSTVFLSEFPDQL